MTDKVTETVLTYNATGTSAGFTVKITASDVAAENLTIESSTTPSTPIAERSITETATFAAAWTISSAGQQGGKATAASSIPKNSQHLARSWGSYGATIYLRTELGQHITGMGFSTMKDNRLEYARFAEYKTTGPGAKATERAPEVKRLTDAEAATYTATKLLAPWVPSFSK